MEKFYLFNVLENGDKVLVNEFESEQAALAAMDGNQPQSLEIETIEGKRVIFSRDREAI